MCRADVNRARTIAGRVQVSAEKLFNSFPIAPPGTYETVLFSHGSRLPATTFSAVSRSRRGAAARPSRAAFTSPRLATRARRLREVRSRKNRGPRLRSPGEGGGRRAALDDQTRRGVPRLTLTLSILAIVASSLRPRDGSRRVIAETP